MLLYRSLCQNNQTLQTQHALSCLSPPRSCILPPPQATDDHFTELGVHSYFTCDYNFTAYICQKYQIVLLVFKCYINISHQLHHHDTSLSIQRYLEG